MTKYAHCVFSEQSSGTRVTKVWKASSASGTFLGRVKWWAHWRRYCFFPAPELLFDCNCLWDLADFVKQQTELRKAERTKR
jgi:hypothetical protein